MDLETVISEVSSWPLQDRLRLIDEVWETISSEESGSVLTAAHTQELQRRLEAYRHDPKAGSPWVEVEARLRGVRP
jgi:putative addiction module component (TIGR02574 family)